MLDIAPRRSTWYRPSRSDRTTIDTLMTRLPGLTVTEVSDLLARVCYRPGWTFTAHQHPFGVWITIDGKIVDAKRRSSYTNVGVRACVPHECNDATTFYAWLDARLAKIEDHERREFYTIDGEPWKDPHAHRHDGPDYRVYREYNTWVVEDHRGAVMSEHLTQAAAFTMAVAYVVADDLRKIDLNTIAIPTGRQ